MKKTVLIFCLCALLSFGTAAQTVSAPEVKNPPEEFKSDGCSMFPDGDYRDCCVAHDWVYRSGGSGRERRRADNALFRCVAAKKGWHHKIIAPVMWAGVRVGGVRFLPTPFRWGFGKKKRKNPPPAARAESEVSKTGEKTEQKNE